MPVQEIAPGIFRIESTLGPRPFAQYLLWGGPSEGSRSLLVDTGVAATPDEVILPALRQVGLDPASLDWVLLSHADVDHVGGNGAVRSAAPRALFCAHALDADWVGSRDRILDERYGWYAAHGPTADYDDAAKTWLRGALGPDVPLDLHLAGGERFRLGPALTIELLHLPGHSPGHVGLWDPASRTAIITDAALGGGLLDQRGTVIHPPPYFDARAYEGSIARLRAFAPARLLTAHYAPIEGPAVGDFLDQSEDFVARARAAVADALAEGEVTLGALLARLGPALGPFTSMPNELAGPIRTHLRELVATGRAEEIAGDPPAWRRVDA